MAQLIKVLSYRHPWTGLEECMANMEANVEDPSERDKILKNWNGSSSRELYFGSLAQGTLQYVKRMTNIIS